MAQSYSVLMVCMGNICRSPTAEGVLRHLVREAGLEQRVHIDSAGTLDYHAGSPPDERSQRHAARRGYDLSSLRARQVHARDFERFDLVLAMDWQNLQELRELCPPLHHHKLRRLMEFAPPGLGDVVDDPYYGGRDGFRAGARPCGAGLPRAAQPPEGRPGRRFVTQFPDYPSVSMGLLVYLTEILKNIPSQGFMPCGKTGRSRKENGTETATSGAQPPG